MPGQGVGSDDVDKAAGRHRRRPGTNLKPLRNWQGLGCSSRKKWAERMADYTAIVKLTAEILDSSCLAGWKGN